MWTRFTGSLSWCDEIMIHLHGETRPWGGFRPRKIIINRKYCCLQADERQQGPLRKEYTQLRYNRAQTVCICILDLQSRCRFHHYSSIKVAPIRYLSSVSPTEHQTWLSLIRSIWSIVRTLEAHNLCEYGISLHDLTVLCSSPCSPETELHDLSMLHWHWQGCFISVITN